MDKTQKPSVAKWACETPAFKTPLTVGQVFTLTCSGVDSVPQYEKGYKLKLGDQDSYKLKILSLKKEGFNEKVFEVVSYKPFKPPLNLEFVDQSGKLVFQSQVSQIQVSSVIKKQDAKPTPPSGYMMVLPPWWVGIVFALFFVLACAGAIWTFVRSHQMKRHFSRILALTKYDDPFLDLNLNSRNLADPKVSKDLFEQRFEESFQNFFYRFFNKNIDLDTNPKLLRRMLYAKSVPSHEVRRVLILKSEYEMLKQSNFKHEQKLEFLGQAKKTLNTLKKYYENNEELGSG